MNFVLDFRDLDRSSLPVVGGKNASLGELIRSGIRVPPGFAVTTASYLHFITAGGIQDALQEALAGLKADDVAALDAAGARARELIRGAPLPGDVEEAVVQGYSGLCQQCGLEGLPVAVRSSATAEDLPTASFAGQQDTYLWVQGAPRVVERVKACWASLFTARAIGYRIRNRFPHDKVLISVGVQKMVNSRSAGVIFTLNPMNGDPSKVVIEGSWGLGETVVSGEVNPDHFVVDKVVMEISQRTISTKHIQCVHDPEQDEVVHLGVAEDLQGACCLEDQEIRELVAVAKRIERHYGCPMDVEWAIDRDFAFPESVFIVQARPETVWSQRRKEPLIGKKTGYQLLMEQAMKRIKLTD